MPSDGLAGFALVTVWTRQAMACWQLKFKFDDLGQLYKLNHHLASVLDRFASKALLAPTINNINNLPVNSH